MIRLFPAEKAVMLPVKCQSLTLAICLLPKHYKMIQDKSKDPSFITCILALNSLEFSLILLLRHILGSKVTVMNVHVCHNH